jgi:hypothetical protein
LERERERERERLHEEVERRGLKRNEDELVMGRESGGNLRQEGGVAVTAEADPNNELEEHNKSLLLDCISHASLTYFASPSLS